LINGETSSFFHDEARIPLILTSLLTSGRRIESSH
jgi:hypothetical protein